jgi:CRISPR-associated protein Cas1
VDSPKCRGCSLAPICLPDEVSLLRTLAEGGPPPPEEDDPEPAEPGATPDDEPDPWGLRLPADPAEPPAREVRRLIAAREPGAPLYVQAQGARVGLEGDRLRVEPPRGEAPTLVRLAHTSHVALYGNVQVTTQALAALLERDIPVFFFSYGGWLRGRTVGQGSGNIELRIAQHRAAADPAAALGLARAFVAAKIRNQRTLLRRNLAAADEPRLRELERLARAAEEAASLPSLLGLEGTAARLYFAAFDGMLRSLRGHPFDLDGRNRRPPRDPVNAMLSMAYSLLSKDCTVAATAVGLDPMLGFLHQPRFGRPALALDLMEEMRPIVADSVVITAVNNDVVNPGHFVRAATGCNLTDAGRRRFIEAYERRLDQLVTHPIFGYRISYRRLLEVQARLLSRTLLGEMAEYPPFRTR